MRLRGVEAGGGTLPRPQSAEPADCGVGVVGARIDDRVFAMVLETVRTAAPPTEGPEADDHPRQAELVPQPVDRGGDEAEILRDQGQIAQVFLDLPKELRTRPGTPAPALRRLVPLRD